MQRFYTAIIEKAKDGFSAFFPDLPGCTSFGETIAEAAINAFSAAQDHAALSREFGDTMAEPRPTGELPAEKGVKEKARLLIPVELSDEPVRVNISLPGAALEALDRTAKELSLSRSGAIAYLALAMEGRTEHAPRKPLAKAKTRA